LAMLTQGIAPPGPDGGAPIPGNGGGGEAILAEGGMV